MSELLEITMILCFGASWPMNVIKSYKSRTAKGKTIAFLCLIFVGYIAGIFSKLANKAYMAEFEQKWYILFFVFSILVCLNVNTVWITPLLYCQPAAAAGLNHFATLVYAYLVFNCHYFIHSNQLHRFR